MNLLSKSRREAAQARDHLSHVCRMTDSCFEEAEVEAQRLFHERPYTEAQAYDRVKDEIWQRWINR